MSNVVSFERPQKPEPHLEGLAKCIGCGHEWEAVAPFGTWHLKCPCCHTMKGMFKHPISADQGDSLFVCNCGCEALVAYYRKGIFRLQCMNCGAHQTEAIFG